VLFLAITSDQPAADVNFVVFKLLRGLLDDTIGGGLDSREELFEGCDLLFGVELFLLLVVFVLGVPVVLLSFLFFVVSEGTA